jgi:hypothetical protein
MASTTSTVTFSPHQPSPLSRTTSPFQDPRTPPSTPGPTAKLWDEYERRAVENAKRRDRDSQGSQPQRSSISELSRNPANVIASARSSFDYKFRSRATASSTTTVAICKTCKQPIAYSSGFCVPCKRTIVLPPWSGEATPPLSPTAREIGAEELEELRNALHREENIARKATSPKRRSFCPMPTQMLDPPIRLSSLRPPSGQEPNLEANRARKVSLTDPNDPFLRLQIAPATYKPRSGSHPASPTYAPTTPPSTSHSRTSTRPSSLANTVSPATPAVHIPTHPYGRHNSATPSEFSSLYPHTSRTASVTTTGYPLQHATSAWDDWDSDEDGEKAGLVGLMKSIGKAKKKERSDSLESVSVKLNAAREEERKKSREGRRSEESEVKAKKKRPSGFVRAISCGGCSED